MKKISSIVIAFIIVIIATSYVSAGPGSSVLQGLFGKMSGNIKGTTNGKIDTLNADIELALGSTLQDLENYQTQRAKTEIENYYNQQLALIANSPELNNGMNELVQDINQLIAAEKARIDAAIAEALAGGQ